MTTISKLKEAYNIRSAAIEKLIEGFKEYFKSQPSLLTILKEFLANPDQTLDPTKAEKVKAVADFLRPLLKSHQELQQKLQSLITLGDNQIDAIDQQARSLGNALKEFKEKEAALNSKHEITSLWSFQKDLTIFAGKLLKLTNPEELKSAEEKLKKYEQMFKEFQNLLRLLDSTKSNVSAKHPQKNLDTAIEEEIQRNASILFSYINESLPSAKDIQHAGENVITILEGWRRTDRDQAIAKLFAEFMHDIAMTSAVLEQRTGTISIGPEFDNAQGSYNKLIKEIGTTIHVNQDVLDHMKNILSTIRTQLNALRKKQEEQEKKTQVTIEDKKETVPEISPSPEPVTAQRDSDNSELLSVQQIAEIYKLLDSYIAARTSIKEAFTQGYFKPLVLQAIHMKNNSVTEAHVELAKIVKDSVTDQTRLYTMLTYLKSFAISNTNIENTKNSNTHLIELSKIHTHGEFYKLLVAIKNIVDPQHLYPDLDKFENDRYAPSSTTLKT